MSFIFDCVHQRLICHCLWFFIHNLWDSFCVLFTIVNDLIFILFIVEIDNLISSMFEIWWLNQFLPGVFQRLVVCRDVFSLPRMFKVGLVSVCKEDDIGNHASIACPSRVLWCVVLMNYTLTCYRKNIVFVHPCILELEGIIIF